MLRQRLQTQNVTPSAGKRHVKYNKDNRTEKQDYTVSQGQYDDQPISLPGNPLLSATCQSFFGQKKQRPDPLRIYGTVAHDKPRPHIRGQSFAHQNPNDSIPSQQIAIRSMFRKQGSAEHQPRNCSSNLTQYSSKQKDPAYIEPFVLPKFEKANQRDKVREVESSEREPFMKPNTMNSSQISFRDLGHTHQETAQKFQASANIDQLDSNTLICSKMYLSTQKHQLIKAEMSEFKEYKQMHKQLRLMKKLQVKQHLMKIGLLSQPVADPLIPASSTQKETLTSLNYCVDEEFDLKLKQQGYLEQKCKSKFESDYDQYECFERQFGKNQIKIGTKGQVICKKQEPVKPYKQYFENREKQQIRMREYNKSETAQYLTHGLRRELPDKNLKTMTAQHSTGTSKTIQLPKLARKSDEKLNENKKAADGEQPPANQIEQKMTIISKIKTKSKTRCQKRRISSLSEMQSGEDIPLKLKGKRNSQMMINTKPKIQIKPIDLSILKTEQMPDDQTIQETSYMQMNSTHTGKFFEDPKNQTTYAFADQHSHTNKSSQRTVSQLQNMQHLQANADIKLSPKADSNERQFRMIEDEQCRNAFLSGYMNQKSQQISLTHRLPNTDTIADSTKMLQKGENMSSLQFNIVQNQNDIFTGGLSLEQNKKTIKHSARSKKQHKRTISAAGKSPQPSKGKVPKQKRSSSRKADASSYIGELEKLRRTSRSNLATSNDAFQKELYINQKLDKFTDMIAKQRISNADLKKTLSKFQLTSPQSIQDTRNAMSQMQERQSEQLAVQSNVQDYSSLAGRDFSSAFNFPSSVNFQTVPNKVEQNTIDIAKKTRLKEVQIFCNNVHKDRLINQIKLRQEKELSPKFLEQKFKIGKWQQFRENKLDVIKKYIHTKRKLSLTRLILIHVVMGKLFFRSRDWLKQEKEIRKRHYYRVFVGLRVILKFKSLWRNRYGGAGVIGITKNRLRHSIVLNHLFATASNEAMIELTKIKRAVTMKQIIRYEQKMKRKNESKRPSLFGRDDDLQIGGKVKKERSRLTGLMSPYVVFFTFLEDRAFEWNNNNLIKRVNRTMELILKIQRRIRSKIEIRKTRIRLIILMQDRLMAKIYKNLSVKKTYGGQRMTEVLGRMISVDPMVKEMVAAAYIDRCIANYNIAFSQWRLYFREKECKHNLNQENLSVEQEGRDVYYELQKHHHSVFMRRRIVEILYKQPAISTKTLYHELLSEMQPLEGKQKKPIPVEQPPFEILNTLPHQITSFAQLQWPEPTTKKEQDSDKVYQRDYRRYKKQLARKMEAYEDPYSPTSPFKVRPEGEEFEPNKDLSPLSGFSPISRHLIMHQLDQMDLQSPVMPRFDFGGAFQKQPLSIEKLPKEFDIYEMLSQSEIESLVYPTYQYRPEYPPSLLFFPTQTMQFRLSRAAFVGAIITRVSRGSKKKTKVDIQQTTTKDVILNISVTSKAKKRKNQQRMFYDESLWTDVLTYLRPEQLEKNIQDMEENMKLKQKITKILSKRKKKESKKSIQVVMPEDIGVDAEKASFFDIQSPDQFGDDDDDMDKIDEDQRSKGSLHSGSQQQAMEMDEDDLIGEEQVIQQTQDEIDSPDPFLPMDEDAEDDGDSSSSSEDGD